jgi:hypothetical protein
MRKSLSVITFVGLLAASSPSLADDDCWAPMADWQPRDAVQKMAEQQGWTVRRIKIHDGCYRIYGRDAKGQEMKLTVNPVTLEIVDPSEDDGNHHGHRDKDEGRPDQNRAD